MSADEFVLDRTENPHPAMLASALKARREAASGLPTYVWFWSGYLLAMRDATGCTEAEVVAWLDRQEESA